MIKEKEVEIVLAGFTVRRLQKLGYVLPTHIYRGERKISTGKIFKIKVGHLSKKSHVKITRICDRCKNEKILRYEKYKPLCFKCSSYKIGMALMGSKNGMFGRKGNLSPRWNNKKSAKEKLEGKVRFFSKESQRWSKKIKEIFDFTCQKCNSRGGRLVSHHIVSWHSNVELRLDPSNGICFCEKCHKKFHKIHGKKNNNKSQLNEFLEKR